jgi:hypothetical protein
MYVVLCKDHSSSNGTWELDIISPVIKLRVLVSVCQDMSEGGGYSVDALSLGRAQLA